jgi:predicted RNA binding protein YcfA (HicA-like mRNA interferase family)
MPFKLKTLSGDQLAKFFAVQGFRLRHITGSHMKLIRETVKGDEMLTVPKHATISKGTTKVIYRQAMRFIPEKDLRDFFYTK